MKVYVHTRAKSRELLRSGATLVFETIRVGFPTAEILVTDGGSAAELIPEIQETVTAAGGKFVGFRDEERHHGNFVWETIRAAGAEPTVVVDPDVVFWASMEDFKTNALWAGTYLPTRQEGGILSLERADPSLLIFPNPEKFVSEWKKRTTKWFHQQPFDACVFVENGTTKRVDCGAAAYSVLKDTFYAFTPKELDLFDHIHAGSYQDELQNLGFENEIEKELRKPYVLIEKFGVEAAKGLWRHQSVPSQKFAWAYASGRVGKYAISFAHFGAYVHVGLLNIETQEFKSGATWTSTHKLHIRMDFADIQLDCNPGKMKEVLEPRPGLGYSFRSVCTDAPATLTVDGEAATGHVWFELERGVMPIGTGWLWISVRLNNGERLCRYDIDKGSYDLQKWSVGKYTVHNTGTMIKDQTAWGIEYTEAFCPVYDGQELVGHAFLEIVKPGWKAFPYALATEAKFNEWGNHNPDAAALLKTLHRISQLADDIADGEVKGSGPVANFGLAALMEVHANPFYIENRATIDPMILASMRFWEVSDEWAKSTDKRTRIFAYAFRESFRIVAWWVATLAGGDQHGRLVLRDMHAFFSIPGGVESFEAWETEQANA